MSALWRKAPYALVFHRSVLVAVFVAALLAALASSSAPFVTTAVASEALKNKLTDLSPLEAGLEITDDGSFFARTIPELIVKANAREAAVRSLAQRLPHVGRPVLTTEAGPLSVAGPGGDTQVLLMARTSFLTHVKVISKSSGGGVWISSITAHLAHLKPGDTLGIRSLGFGSDKLIRVRVKGVYRALAYSPPEPYWFNFNQEIYPQSLDASPGPSYVFTSRDEVYRLLLAASSNGVRGSGGAEGGRTIAELPVDPKGLTLAEARGVERRFVAVRRALPSSSLGQKLGCTKQFQFRPCHVSSSITEAVILADRNASAVTPAVSLLSDVGGAIALAVAAAAGAFLVRRRRAEASLLYARGEHVARFGGRTALEALLPTLLGGMAGFGLAFALTDVFAPSGSIDPATVWSGAAHAAVAVAIGLLLLVTAASFAFLHLYDTGVRRVRWLRRLPWELPVLAVALFLLFQIRSGGGLNTSGGSQHPTLAVFVFPLLVVAALAGLGARVARLLLRSRSGGRARAQRSPVYLALRRLAAARGLLVLLVVVSAVALGAFFYAETLSVSLKHTTTEKAYMATGSDVQGTIQQGESLPHTFPYPITRVQVGNQSATVGGPTGQKVDVMVVDPATLTRTLHWESDWGTNPNRLLRRLAGSPSRPLPVIVTSDVPRTPSLYIEGVRFPMQVLGRIKAFPVQSVGVPLLITSFRALDEITSQAKVYAPLGVPWTYVWAKGPPDRVQRALAASSLGAFYISTVDTYLRNPDVVLATRTYGFMRTMALAAGVLVVLGLLLYLQARQRSQAIASALARRMGFGRGAETLSLCLELGAILLFAAVVGGGVAIVAARPITRHIDPLPRDAPSPIFAVPTTEIFVAAAALVVLTILAGVLTSWFAARADVSEALRVD